MWRACVFVVLLLALALGHQRPLDLVDGSHLGGATSRRLSRSLNSSWTAGYNWNGVVDTIFSIAQQDILSQGKDRIVLSDAKNFFKYRFGFLTVQGEFRAWEGSLTNLTHFRRSGDVSVLKVGDVWEMKCTMTLDDLQVRYERYEFKVMGLGVTGHLEGRVDSNTVRMTLHFAKTEDGGCMSSLQGVTMSDLKGLKVDITGLNELNGVGSAIATWIVKTREKEIVDIVERVFKREIEKALKEFQCDEYIVLLML